MKAVVPLGVRLLTEFYASELFDFELISRLLEAVPRLDFPVEYDSLPLIDREAIMLIAPALFFLLSSHERIFR